MSLQIVSHYRITCDADGCPKSLNAPEDWSERKIVSLWEVYDGVADTWEHGRAYCEDHADMYRYY